MLTWHDTHVEIKVNLQELLLLPPYGIQRLNLGLKTLAELSHCPCPSFMSLWNKPSFCSLWWSGPCYIAHCWHPAYDLPVCTFQMLGHVPCHTSLEMRNTGNLSPTHTCPVSLCLWGMTDTICNCFGILLKIMFFSSWYPEDDVLLLRLRGVCISVSVHGHPLVSAAACKVQRRALEIPASCWVWATWQEYWKLNFGAL